MPFFTLLLLSAQLARPAEPVGRSLEPAAPTLTRGYPACAAVRVSAPNLAAQPRNLTYSSRQILDLRFQARLRQDLQGDHLMQFKVLTPGGFLYQVLTVPFVGTAKAPDASTRAEHARSGAALRAPGPPPARAVPGYPRPLPVQRLVRVAGDSQTRVYYSVNATLPVAGTSITLSSLYGPWTVQAYVDGEPTPCGPATRFTIRD
jgi:hypothetical protein